MNETYDRHIAKTIYAQLGGDAFANSIRAHSFSTVSGGLTFKVPPDLTIDHGNGKTLMVLIKLTPADTYEVKGLGLGSGAIKRVTETFCAEDIYYDQLAEVVRQYTGLDEPVAAKPVRHRMSCFGM